MYEGGANELPFHPLSSSNPQGLLNPAQQPTSHSHSRSHSRSHSCSHSRSHSCSHSRRPSAALPTHNLAFQPPLSHKGSIQPQLPPSCQGSIEPQLPLSHQSSDWLSTQNCQVSVDPLACTYNARDQYEPEEEASISEQGCVSEEELWVWIPKKQLYSNLIQSSDNEDLNTNQPLDVKQRTKQVPQTPILLQTDQIHYYAN